MSGSERPVRCPICLDEFSWPNDEIYWMYDEQTGTFEPLGLAGVPGVKRLDLLRRGYVSCPNPSGDSAKHFLPATYATYSDPVVIGLVGAPASGKTHLLASMVSAMVRGSLASLGLHVTPLDFHRFDNFRRDTLDPLERGQVLPGTNNGIREYACAVLLHTKTRTTPLVFFDVAGEDFTYLSSPVRFVLGADALLFTCAVDSLEPQGQLVEEVAISSVVDRLRGIGRIDKMAAAVVMTKADQQRFLHPVRDWLVRDGEPRLDRDEFLAESRDVFAFLHRMGRTGALVPYEVFQRCTLHFTSATGREAGPEFRFERGIRPMRVLQPLLSVLSMTGVFE